MKHPSPLKANDLIYITAPAKAIEAHCVFYAKKMLEEKGYRVEVSPNCLGKHHYFSGTDEERIADLQAGLDRTDINAILCARGGYGCVRILDRLNWDRFEAQPKWLIGFSDVTVFHHRVVRMGSVGIHGSMPLNFEENTVESIATILQAVEGQPYHIQAPNYTHNVTGSTEGKLIGGNLSIVFSMLGTDDAFDFTDAILFIEDISEQLYHVDRMFFTMKKAGILKRIKGLVVGGMTDMRDTAEPFGCSLEELIISHVGSLGIPVAFGFPCGHQPNNQALVFGQKARFIVEQKGAELYMNEVISL
jgi:muramoyltetrapeptide carboxypeptidase